MKSVRSSCILLVLSVLGLLLITAPSVSQADTKMHALVIGNGAYAEHGLKNPGNDAKLMDQSLRELGFEVTLALDAEQEAMEMAVIKFARSIPKGGLALFYFAGHGVEVGGKNYLIPTDAKLSDEMMVKYKTVSQDLVLDLLDDSGSNMNVVVLDCCRDNPFQRSWSRSVRTRGLAAPSAIPEGTLIAYATAPGTTARDGDGDNSPYTKELALALAKRPERGLMLRDVFFDASKAVKRSTGQRPWINIDASLDRFYLRKPLQYQTAEQSADTLATRRKNASEQLTSTTRPAARPRLEMRDKDDKPVDNSLLWQGDTYANEGNYDLAIETYTAIISNSSGPEDRELRKQARIARGSVYMQRAIKSNKIKDFQFALIDYKSTGRPGIRLAVRADSANLMVKKAVTGKVSKYQTALVTQARKGWFWVNSVNGNDKLQGWVSSDAFSEAAKAKPAKETIVRSRPASQPTSGTTNYTPPSTSYTPPITNYNPQPQNTTPRPVAPSGTYPQPQFTYGNQSSSRNYNNGRTYNNGQYGNGYSSNQWGTNTQRTNTNQWGNRSTNNSSAPTFNQRYMKKNGRPPSIWETPKWESPAEIRRGRANGTLR